MSHPILKKDRYSRRRALKAIIILPSFKRMLLQGLWLAIYQHVALQILEHNWMLPGFVSGFWNKGKKGGTIQIPSKQKWSFSFMGEKNEKVCNVEAFGILRFHSISSDIQGAILQTMTIFTICLPKSIKIQNGKSKNRSQGGKWTVTPRATNGSLTKIGVVWQKLDFWTKNRDFGPKKNSLLYPNHVLATTGKSCSKKKVAFAQIIITQNIILGDFLD